MGKPFPISRFRTTLEGMNGKANGVFLTAEWSHLAMLNYAIDPSILTPLVPAGTELDRWNHTTYISVIGLLFTGTKVSGFSIPFHRNFEEVNLRFYVRRKSIEGWRRGVVFIKEIVPRSMIAVMAQYLYNEPYISLPMSHRIETGSAGLRSVRYNWRFDGRPNFLQATVSGAPQPLPIGSEAEFITEHYWGYNRQRDGSTLEYRVEHPRWSYYEVSEATLQCDVAGIYGSAFQASLSRAPLSAFLAAGSAISVHHGVPLQ